MAWSGIQITRNPIHYNFILGLGNLVLAQVESLGQSDIVFRLIRASSWFTGWTTHRECARFHPDHFEVLGRIDKMIRARCLI